MINQYFNLGIGIALAVFLGASIFILYNAIRKAWEKSKYE